MHRILLTHGELIQLITEATREHPLGVGWCLDGPYINRDDDESDWAMNRLRGMRKDSTHECCERCGHARGSLWCECPQMM